MQLLKCAVGFHGQFSCGMTLKKFILGGWRPLVVPILWPPIQNHGHPTAPPQTRSPRTATDFINDYDKCRLNFLLHKAFASCRKWHQMSLLSASHVISRCCNVIALVGALVKPETEE